MEVETVLDGLRADLFHLEVDLHFIVPSLDRGEILIQSAPDDRADRHENDAARKCFRQPDFESIEGCRARVGDTDSEAALAGQGFKFRKPRGDSSRVALVVEKHVTADRWYVEISGDTFADGVGVRAGINEQQAALPHPVEHQFHGRRVLRKTASHVVVDAHIAGEAVEHGNHTAVQLHFIEAED